VTVPATIRLRDGRRLAAVNVRYYDHWLRADVLRWRVDYDPERDVGRRVLAGTSTRRFPASAVVEVIEREAAA
jgi:hypothetical protein